LHFISFLFCSLVLLERYNTHPGYAVLMAPVQDQLSPSWTTFLRPAAFGLSDLLLFPWHRLLLQDFVPMRIPLHAQDYGWSLAHHLLPRLLLSCRNVISSPWMPGATTVFSTGQINSIKYQLKLAGVARGVPGDHGQQNFFYYWIPTSLLFNSALQSETSGHEPCCASPGCSPSDCILSFSIFALFFRWFGFRLAYSTGSRV
jgi:hypothetical protein